MRLYLILLFQCILIQCLSAQESIGPNFRRNIVSIEGETDMWWSVNALISYERLYTLVEAPYSVSWKAGIGFDSYHQEGFIIKYSFSFIRRLKRWPRGGLELNLGVAYRQYENWWGEIHYGYYPIVC